MSGYAREVVGGEIEGTTEVWVTNNNPWGDGSLNQLVSRTDIGPRIVKFAVGGKFPCYHVSAAEDYRMHITDGNITIAGETAPYPGVTIYNPTGDGMGVGGMLSVGAYKSTGQTPDPDLGEIVIRGLRFRYGDGVRDVSQAVKLSEGHNIAIMHCSFQWTPDNQLACWLWHNWPGLYNVTYQYNLFAEPFSVHPTSLVMHGWGDVENPGDTDYKNIYNLNAHHNLFVHAGHRTPLSVTGGFAFYNNVIYNTPYRMWQTQQEDRSDFRNNILIGGPDQPDITGFIHQLYDPTPGLPASLYIGGNWFPDVGSPPDAWGQIEAGQNTGIPLDTANQRLTPLIVPDSGEVTADAALLADVLAKAGAIRPFRDAVDWMYVHQVVNRTGRAALPANMADVGGYPYG